MRRLWCDNQLTEYPPSVYFLCACFLAKMYLLSEAVKKKKKIVDIAGEFSSRGH